MVIRIIVAVLGAVASYALVSRVWRNKFTPISKSRIELFIAGFLIGGAVVWLINPQDFTSIQTGVSAVLLAGTIGGILFSVGMPNRYRYFVEHIQPTLSKGNETSKPEGE